VSAAATRPVAVFVSFDPEHDRDLYERLLEQSRAAGSGFTVCGSSRGATASDFFGDGARRAIRNADQMIVLCGEHTEASLVVSGELHIARQEGTPFILVWGRREAMCERPRGVEPGEAMYGWTDEILRERIRFVSRMAAQRSLAATSE
jgi:hypothetical protein